MQKTAVPTSLLSKLTLLSFVLLATGACTTTRPSVEYVLAREAFNAAKDSESARFAPGYYHKAEETFRRGVQAYQERYFDEAIENFKASRLFAERAENAAHIQRSKSGEDTP
jgi:hypothetical protein